jgi:prophage regulatory protein
LTDTPTLISMNETIKLTSLSRTSINVRRAQGNFPQAVMLGEKRVAFVRQEVLDWVQARIAERGAQRKRGAA